LDGAFEWARRALNRQKRRFPARADLEEWFELEDQYAFYASSLLFAYDGAASPGDMSHFD
jgi:hypothetical protein